MGTTFFLRDKRKLNLKIVFKGNFGNVLVGFKFFTSEKKKTFLGNHQVQVAVINKNKVGVSFKNFFCGKYDRPLEWRKDWQ